MEENKQIVTKESPRAREGFLTYFNQGADRSAVKVREEFGKKGIKIGLRIIEKWSSQFSWVERCQVMDQEVFDKAEQIAIKEAIAKKSDILKAVKNTMIRYNQAILSGQIVPSASDFKKMWEVARVELGKPTGQEIQPIQTPAINIFLTKNEKIIQVVKKAQNELREALQGEIGEEKQQENIETNNQDIKNGIYENK